MGWTFGYKSRAQALREELQGVFIHKQANGRGCVWLMIDSHRGGKAILVALLEQNGGSWGAKILDESCGPSACDCPLEWIEEVPDPGAYATKWRERVRAHHELTGSIARGNAWSGLSGAGL